MYHVLSDYLPIPFSLMDVLFEDVLSNSTYQTDGLGCVHGVFLCIISCHLRWRFYFGTTALGANLIATIPTILLKLILS